MFIVVPELKGALKHTSSGTTNRRTKPYRRIGGATAGACGPLLRVFFFFLFFVIHVGGKRSPLFGERLRSRPDAGDIGVFPCRSRLAVGASFFIFGSARFLF